MISVTHLDRYCRSRESAGNNCSAAAALKARHDLTRTYISEPKSASVRRGQLPQQLIHANAQVSGRQRPFEPSMQIESGFGSGAAIPFCCLTIHDRNVDVSCRGAASVTSAKHHVAPRN